MSVATFEQRAERETRAQASAAPPAADRCRAVVATTGCARQLRPSARTAGLPLDGVLARAVARRAGMAAGSASERLLQRLPVKVAVSWGITHVVEELNDSIFEGEEIGEPGELSAGDALVIDDEDTILSRRGPNQEVNTFRDASGPQQYRWYRIIQLRGRDVSQQRYYIRDGTFVADQEPPPASGHPPLSEESFSDLETELRGICVSYLGVVTDYGDGATVSSSALLGKLFAHHGIQGSLHEGDNTSLDSAPGRTALIAIIRRALELLVLPLKGPLKTFRDRLMARAFNDGGCIAARVTSLSDAVITISHVLEAVKSKAEEEPIKLVPDNEQRKAKIRRCLRELYDEMLREHQLAEKYKRTPKWNWERCGAEAQKIQAALQCVVVLDRLSASKIPHGVTYFYNRLCQLANQLLTLSNAKRIRACVLELGTMFTDCRDVIEGFWPDFEDTMKTVDFNDPQDDQYPAFDDSPSRESVDTLLYKLLSRKPPKLSPPKTGSK